METTARDAFVELAARLGAVEITLPQGFHDVLLAHERISDSEAANEFSDEHRAHEEVRSPQLRRILQRGREVGPHEYAAALTLTRTLSSAIEATLRTCDVLITPATLGEAPQGVAESGDAIFCRPWSLLGNPVVAVPVLTGAAGLPLGIQVVGSRGSDGATVAAAEWISQQSEHYYAGL